VTAASDLRGKVDAMWRPGDELAIATDAHSTPGTTLVAIRRPTFSGVLAVSSSEYCGIKLAKMCGFDLTGGPSR
jgi:hypothetical protein